MSHNNGEVLRARRAVGEFLRSHGYQLRHASQGYENWANNDVLTRSKNSPMVLAIESFSFELSGACLQVGFALFESHQSFSELEDIVSKIRSALDTLSEWNFEERNLFRWWCECDPSKAVSLVQQVHGLFSQPTNVP